MVSSRFLIIPGTFVPDYYRAVPGQKFERPPHIESTLGSAQLVGLPIGSFVRTCQERRKV
jgi:hypothetical protein